jgi:hypothetical protein
MHSLQQQADADPRKPQTDAGNFSGSRRFGMMIAHAIDHQAMAMHSINKGGKPMGYGIAWLLGVPVSVLLIWYVVTHVL